MPKIKIQEKSQITFCKILKNKWYHTKVLLKRFHLNGHTIGFHPQTQKLELHYTDNVHRLSFNFLSTNARYYLSLFGLFLFLKLVKKVRNINSQALLEGITRLNEQRFEAKTKQSITLYKSTVIQTRPDAQIQFTKHDSHTCILYTSNRASSSLEPINRHSRSIV